MGLSPSQFGSIDEYLVALKLERDKFKRDLRETLDTSEKQITQKLGGAVEGVEKKFLLLSAAAQIGSGLMLRAFDAVVQTLSRVAIAATNIVTNFVQGSVQIASSMQMMEISLTNMLGSGEAAVAMMTELRKKALLLGQDPIQFTQAARRFIPVAKGDIDLLNEILTLSQQLATSDPVAGFRGAGRALTEAFTGQVRSLSAIFELNRTQLTELKNEWEATGDTMAFVMALQEEVASQTGIAASDIAAIMDTAQGSVNRLKGEMVELQVIMGQILLEGAIQESLEKLSDAFEANKEDIKKAVFEVAIVMAAIIKSVTLGVERAVGRIAGFAEMFKAIADEITTGVDNFFMTIEDATVNTITTVVDFAVGAINKFVEGINTLARSLGIESQLKPLIVDMDSLEESIRSTSGAMRTSFVAGFNAAIGKVEQLTGLFPGFKGFVEDFREQFASLLEPSGEVPGIPGGGLGGMVDEEELQEQLGKIRDIIEKHEERLVKERERFQERIATIDERAAERSEDVIERTAERRAKVIKDAERDIAEAQTSFITELADIEADAQEASVEAEKRRTDTIESINEQHAETLRRIRMRVQQQLFDAVNARDARRVFEILQQAKLDTKEAGRDRRKAISEINQETKERARELKRRVQEERALAKAAFEQELIDIATQAEEKLVELDAEQAKKLADIEENRLEEREKERQAHQKRMQDLHRQQQDRIRELARGWAEEGKLTQEALSHLIRMAGQVFGPRGEYMDLIRGFNEGLAFQAQVTQGLLQSMGASAAGISSLSTATFREGEADPFTSEAIEDLTSGVGLSPEQIAELLRRQAIGAQHGFDGIVNKSTLFQTHGKERVTITPVNGPGGSSDELNVNVRVDARGVSKEFEADLTAHIARVVGEGARGRRRSRRG